MSWQITDFFNEAIDRKRAVLGGRTKNKENVVGKHTFWTEMNQSSLRTWTRENFKYVTFIA